MKIVRLAHVVANLCLSIDHAKVELVRVLKLSFELHGLYSFFFSVMRSCTLLVVLGFLKQAKFLASLRLRALLVRPGFNFPRRHGAKQLGARIRNESLPAVCCDLLGVPSKSRCPKLAISAAS